MATGTWNEKEKKKYLVFTIALKHKQKNLQTQV